MTIESTIDLNLDKQDIEILQEAIKDPVASVRSLAMNDLSMFIEYFWDTYSDDKFIDNWHIGVITKELEEIARLVGDNQPKDHDLLINVPPGTSKTAMVSIFWPIWCWVNWYWMRFITSSHSADLSLESAEYSRDIIRSDKFKQIFPDLRIKVDKDTKSNFRVTKFINGKWVRGGNRLSTSVGSKIIGFHAHIIIADDLVDSRAAISKAKLEEAHSHMDLTLSTRKVNKEVTTTVMIAQRLSPSDPSGHWLDKGKKNIRHISLPGEIANYEEYLKPAKYKKHYVDQLLDDNRMSWKVLDEMKADLGQYGFHGQVGQNPILAGAGMFDVDMLNIIYVLPTSVYIADTIRYWDKAASDGKGAFTAGVKMHKLTNGNYVIEHVKRGQWNSTKREEIIKSTTISDGKDSRPYIEQEGGSGGKESAEATVKNLAGFATQKDRPTGNKIWRADTLSVQVNDGNVSLLFGDWNKAYIDELRDFPVGTYKDQVDASSGAFNNLVNKKQVKVHRRG